MNNTKDTESKTLDVKKSIRFTDRVTLRIDPETKRLLTKVTKTMGISACQLIHSLLTAYFYGLGDKLDLDVKSPTINLTIEREVKRVRRYAREYDAGKVRIETVGSSEKCAYGCVGRVLARHFVYSDPQHCVETFVCQRHHEELKRQRVSWTMV